TRSGKNSTTPNQSKSVMMFTSHSPLAGARARRCARHCSPGGSADLRGGQVVQPLRFVAEPHREDLGVRAVLDHAGERLVHRGDEILIALRYGDAVILALEQLTDDLEAVLPLRLD